jgi:hypothetical protein
MKPEVDDDAQNDDFVPGDIFSSHRMRSSKRFEKYRREMEEYGESPTGVVVMYHANVLRGSD